MRANLIKLLIVITVFSVTISPLSTLPIQAQENIQYTLPPKGEKPEGEFLAPIDERLSQSTGKVSVVIELEDTPAAIVYGTAISDQQSQRSVVNATKAQVDKIDAAQTALLEPLSQLDAIVLYRTQRVYNGIAVSVDAAELTQIASLPGVKAVHKLVAKEIDNWHSVPLIGAPEVWDAAGLDLTGAGVSIGVIDSGIDYIHADFGGPTVEDAYLANDTTIITDTYGGNALYPTAKVVGGWDFVGDAYDAGSDNEEDLIPHPDADPASCYTGGDSADHGTHVAGIAGGYGVNADGTTYVGPYNNTLTFEDFKIGPGVAPEAELYSLRVFGCDGSTLVTDQAIEWAMDPNDDGDLSDHLDIINMSLGSGYGSTYDTSAIAADNAAAAGVVVVASSGNAGNTYYITGSPGASSRTISVAGSDDGAYVAGSFRVHEPVGISEFYPAVDAAFGPTLEETGPITNTLVYPESQGDGCGEEGFDNTNAAAINGHIVLLDRGECNFTEKVLNAQDAGAVAVLMANNAPSDPIIMGGDPPLTVTIPSQMTSLDVGDLLKANPTVSMTMAATFPEDTNLSPSMQDTIYTSSSRGPRVGDSLLKPDITAPGVTIYSALNGTGTDGASYNGTSMAAPHIAGTMALLRQQNPNWSVEELKALVMNTAGYNIHQDTNIHSPARIGAGRVSVSDAANATSVAYAADHPGMVSLTFGALEILEQTTITQTLLVVNKSSTSPITYTLTYSGVVDIPGVEYTLPITNVTIPASGLYQVPVVLTANPALMQHTHDATVDEIIVLPRVWISEEAGYVVLTPESGSEVLRVPAHAVAQPASEMSTDATSLSFTTLTQVLALDGQGIYTGPNLPTDILSLVSTYELQVISENEETSTDLTNNADLQYVGVTSDYYEAGEAIADTTIYFGIATHGNWTSPSETEFDIYIDVDQDGEDDYVLYNTSYPANGNIYLSRLFNLNEGGGTYEYFTNGFNSAQADTALFNSNVMMLAVSAASLGIDDPANARFDYYLATYSRHGDDGFDTLIDITDHHTFDPAAPGLVFGETADGYYGGWPNVDLPGVEIPVTVAPASYLASNSQGILLLHHHNADGNRAEVVEATDVVAIYGVNLSDNNTGNGPAGEVVSYTVSITNTGNVPDTFSIAISHTWETVSSISEITLEPGVMANFNVQVTVPMDALEGYMDVATVIARATSEPTATDSVRLTTIMDPRIYRCYLPLVPKAASAVK